MLSVDLMREVVGLAGFMHPLLRLSCYASSVGSMIGCVRLHRFDGVYLWRPFLPLAFKGV